MITRQHKADEAARELATRERVYPSWVKDRKLEADVAEHRTAVMRAILADYMETLPLHANDQSTVEIAATVWVDLVQRLEMIARNGAPAVASTAKGALANLVAGRVL